MLFDKKGKKISENFQETYYQILRMIKILKGTQYISLEVELYSFMDALTTYCIATNSKRSDKKTYKIHDEFRDHLLKERFFAKIALMEYTKERQEFYHEFILNENSPRGDFFYNINYSAEKESPEAKLCIAFIDVIYNPECIKNYVNAPLVSVTDTETSKKERMLYTCTMRNIESAIKKYIEYLDKN